MKVNYEKPVIIFETFALSQTIAQDCGESAIGNTNHYSKSSCGYYVGDGTVWTSDNLGCGVAWPEDIAVNGYCYNNPDGGISVFSS
ncbi:MAG: hypothetical protein LUG54_01405 [Clostridiales bacterium]|nr:hypothetical protein [Clostridiales bacterium]